MQFLSETILAIVPRRPGISDPELAFAIYGLRTQQLVNSECNFLTRRGRLVRRVRPDGVIGNYPTETAPS